MKFQAIMCKKESKFSIALDRDGNQLSVKDIVKVVDGPYAVNFSICLYFSKNE